MSGVFMSQTWWCIYIFLFLGGSSQQHMTRERNEQPNNISTFYDSFPYYLNGSIHIQAQVFSFNSLSTFLICMWMGWKKKKKSLCTYKSAWRNDTLFQLFFNSHCRHIRLMVVYKTWRDINGKFILYLITKAIKKVVKCRGDNNCHEIPNGSPICI